MKGFFSFAVVIAMLVIILIFSLALQNNNLFLEKTKNGLMKIEQANKERTIIENNTDKIILLKLEEQIHKQNFNTTLIQNEINSKLFSYLKDKSSAMNLFFEETGAITINYLNQNTTTFILKANGLNYAEYTYCSSTLKNTFIGKNILGTGINFYIPIGYTIKIIRAI